MRSKPLIGLNADYRAAKKDAPAFTFVCAGYYDSIVEAGGIPLVLPPVDSDDDLKRLMDLLDGMVMVGGADLDPRRDGYMLHPSVRPLDQRREMFDRRLMNMIAKRRMPVFGIGVGMQLLNVAQGGTLLLHIPEDLPKALPHKDPRRMDELNQSPEPRVATGRGRPTLYRPDLCERAREHCQRGASLDQLAGLLGVAPRSIDNWITRIPDANARLDAIYRATLLRAPHEDERAFASAAPADLLWSLVLLPEFQLIR